MSLRNDTQRPGYDNATGERLGALMTDKITEQEMQEIEARADPVPVLMKGIISQIPYAAYRWPECDELLGYADDHFGPIVLGPDMKSLKTPIEVKVIKLDESSWE